MKIAKLNYYIFLIIIIDKVLELNKFEKKILGNPKSPECMKQFETFRTC